MKSASQALPVKPAQTVIPFKRKPERRGDELAFLPAALEIVETPPSPIGTPAGGKHHPAVLSGADLVLVRDHRHRGIGNRQDHASGRTKVIQPFETGVVRSIRVQDGQAVKAGDVLIELDPTVNAAEPRSFPERSARREAQHRAAACGACGSRRSRAGFRRSCRRGPGIGRHPSGSFCSVR